MYPVKSLILLSERIKVHVMPLKTLTENGYRKVPLYSMGEPHGTKKG